MMEKLAQAGGVGVQAQPLSLYVSTITKKVVVYTQAERAGTLSHF